MTDASRLSLDEIQQLLTDIARNGEGADKFRALKMIATMNSAQAALPDPVSDADIVGRLVRLLKAAGYARATKAMSDAFPPGYRPPGRPKAA